MGPSTEGEDGCEMMMNSKTGEERERCDFDVKHVNDYDLAELDGEETENNK